MNMNTFGYWGYAYAPLGIILWILLWVIIISIIIRLMRGSRSHDARHHHYRDRDFDEGSSALDVLRERYARGEIDTEEFREKKAELMK